MISLHHDKAAAADFPALLALYPDEELPTITRSTVPFLAYWRAYPERVPSLLSRLGAGQSDSARLHFEFTVPSAVIPATRRPNRPSHTDLMIFADGLAAAVEAKWTEPRYETVRDWLGTEQTENKLGVIDHWLAMIGRKIGTSLSRDDFQEVVYQMVHRAASACHSKADRVALIYQCFGVAGSDVEGYASDLRNFHRLLGQPESFSFFLHRCTLEPTEHFKSVRESIGIDSGKPAAIIRKAFLEDELFRFTQDELIPI